MLDHRLIHRETAVPGLASTRRLDLLKGGLQVTRHRSTLLFAQALTDFLCSSRKRSLISSALPASAH
jgi:hypothetical protein